MMATEIVAETLDRARLATRPEAYTKLHTPAASYSCLCVVLQKAVVELSSSSVSFPIISFETKVSCMQL
jgi:hypothetical protein